MTKQFIISFLLSLTFYCSSQNSILDYPDTIIKLDLSEQNIIELPNEFLKYKRLESLDLGYNPALNLQQVLSVINGLDNIKVLKLNDCEISTIPNSIINLKKLTELNLSSNQISTFPESLKKLDNLTYLKLFSNQLSQIQLKDGDLASLESIDLCHNYFEVFPIELSNLKNLKNILIWYNQINYISDEISNFDHLEELNLDHNRLTVLPKSISQLNNLKVLVLKGNMLTEKSINPIYSISSLEDLDLEFNQIRLVSKKIINLKNLKQINFSRNPITSIPIQMKSLNDLEQIGLGELTNFDWEGTFTTLSEIESLKRIGMYRMNLETMPKGFEKLQQVKSFWLFSNLFNDAEKEGIRKLVPNAKVEF